MNYPIYRTKAALRFSLSRNCSAFIEGAPAIAGRQGQMQKGERKYDWQNQKIAMSVSPEELLAIAAACESLRIKGTCPLPPFIMTQRWEITMVYPNNSRSNPTQIRGAKRSLLP